MESGVRELSWLLPRVPLAIETISNDNCFLPARWLLRKGKSPGSPGMKRNQNRNEKNGSFES